MKIKDIVEESRGVITVKASDKVGDALKVLLEKKINNMPVLDDGGKLVGMISERDVLREVYANPDGMSTRLVGDAMTKDIIVCVAGDDLDYIMNIMTKNNIRHIPIMSGQTLTGIVTIRDVIRGLMHIVESENRYLKDYIEGKYEGYM